ncbi:MAG TPA: hypothetical protein VEI02_13660 [Planctomycetota bacterium]|nr:hypothetical protein [Planctomycetota bacterium]
MTTVPPTNPNGSADVHRIVAHRDYDRPSLIVHGWFSHAGPWTALGFARLAPAAPVVDLAGSAGGVTLTANGLLPGRTYVNVFSVEGATQSPGVGPWAGLYASDPLSLLAQVALPIGTEPFSLVASSASYAFGPALLPPGLATLDVLSADVTPGSPILVSKVARYRAP